MEEYTAQGLYEARSVLVLDLDRCTRCDECTRGCVKRHGSESHGVPVARLMRDGMRFGQFLVATSCRSCETPHCMSGCPVDAIQRPLRLRIVPTAASRCSRTTTCRAAKRRGRKR